MSFLMDTSTGNDHHGKKWMAIFHARALQINSCSALNAWKSLYKWTLNGYTANIQISKNSAK